MLSIGSYINPINFLLLYIQMQKVQRAKDNLMELLMSIEKQSKVMVFVDCTEVLQYLAFVFLFTAAFILDFLTL